jgi:hypothetical protein
MFLPASIEPSDSQVHELWIFGEVPVGIFNGNVTEVGRENGQASLNILPRAIPINKGANRKSVPEIMQPWTGPGHNLSDSSNHR